MIWSDHRFRNTLTRAADFVTITAAMSMQTETLIVGGDGVGSPAIREAAEILKSGGLVAFPTETVYGIGANAGDAAAVERLRALKERPEDKPFSVHIGDRGDLATVVNPVPVIAQRLMDAFWPAGLTGAGRWGI
jgi:L-threonylcarbamoyladenylate synthase